ncbi:MAG: response regulator transcription factor [Ignavibacteriales bacterium]|nr:response regulator transcription factor [Ignavibacteriales bacterium]
MNDKLKILIADDHPLLRQGLLYIINKNENFNIVAEASDGQDALNLIREKKPDITILDVQMPKLDGFEVAKIIIKERLATKIIFLTMFKDVELIKKVFDLGIKGFVLKENAVNDIVNCIESVSEDKFFISPQASDILLKQKEQKKKPEDDLLTPSEKKIINLIAQDKSSKEIAEELFISVKTVENHRSNICKKLGITGNSALLIYALKNKISEKS